MALSDIWSRTGTARPRNDGQGSARAHSRFVPALQTLEDRTLLFGYLAIGAGAGADPLVAIRVDRVDALTSSPTPPPLGGTNPAASDGKTDTTSQVFLAYDQRFRGGVHVATANFDGFTDNLRRDPTSGQFVAGADGLDDFPDYLIVAPGAGGGPHIKVYRLVETADGNIVVNNLVTQFLAYDPRFTGGVNITTGDLDGDGRAELITGAGPGGGPHVKVWKLDVSDSRMVLVNELMAYDSKFRGGVSVASGQGYQTRTLVQQELDQPHPTGFVETPYPAAQGVPKPGAAGGFPLSGTTINAQLQFVGTFTVASGGVSYLGANLLNNYGNLAYTPNVDDEIPPTFDDFPFEFPLVYVTWPASSTRRPAFMPADTPIGPFVRLPDAGSTPVVQPLTAGPGAVHFRNQLITGPGPGGGPIVRVWDFVNGANGFVINEQIEFLGGDANDRGGINVSIGTVVDNILENGATVIADRTGPRLATSTFPYPTSIYSQLQPAIIVASAGGTGVARAFADAVAADGLGHVTQKRTLADLNLRPVLLNSVLALNPNDPLNGFQTLQDTPLIPFAIDPQYRGEVLAAVSGLQFNGDGQTARAQYVFAAGARQNTPSRGARVKIFDNLGTTPTPVLPSTGVGTQDPRNPIDDFQAFLSGAFPNGVGGVAFGFGQLPMPTTDIVTLTPRSATSVTDPFYLTPDPQP